LLLLLVCVSVQAQDDVLKIRITQGIEGAQPISIAPFSWNGGNIPPPTDMAQVIADDLARSARFAPVPFSELPSRPTTADQINYQDFRMLGTANLVIGRLTQGADQRFVAEFRLFDVFRAQQITGFQVESSAADLRRKAHQFSDIIYERLTGERGAFDTRIAYITEHELGDPKRRYRLMVADSDGFNPQATLQSPAPILSPSWSPDGQQLAYVSFEQERPRIYIQELATGTRRMVSDYPGLNSAPSFSPDGSRLALALSKDGNPEIYVLYLGSNRLQRLTNNPAIDTEPAWSPDGRAIIFTSDRGGTPNIYRLPITGGREERLTFEGGYNSRATFAPQGTKIAFVHQVDGRFSISTLDLENGAIRVLTDTRLDESPSFAPNGSMILYATSDDEGSSLAAVSTDGRVRQRLGEAAQVVREPAWGPFRNP
jgi:TolB protein